MEEWFKMISVGKTGSYKGIIGVCGGSALTPENFGKTVKLGEEIAKNGYIVICGGLGGTMEAVCKGVKKAGGMSIGILPGENKTSANKYVDIVIPTGLGEARNLVIVQTADGIISVSGGAGTLSEIAFAWRLKKPIVALKTTGGWSEKLANVQIDKSRPDKIVEAATPEQAVALLIQLLKEHEEGKKY